MSKHPEPRRCRAVVKHSDGEWRECGRRLAAINKFDLCFYHASIEEFLKESESGYMLPTVCSSRVTKGFNQVERDYYGCLLNG